MLHVTARGKLAKRKNNLDNTFSVEEGVTPFDLYLISSKYMA